MYNCTGKGVLNIRMTMVLIMMMMLTGFVGSRCSQIVEAMITRGLLIRWTIPFWKYFQNIFRIGQILDLFLWIIVTVHSRVHFQNNINQGKNIFYLNRNISFDDLCINCSPSMLLCPNHCLRLNHCRWKKWFKCNQILCTLQSLKLEKNISGIYKTTNIWADTYVTFTSICTEYFRHHSECEAAPGVVVLQRCHGGSSTSRRTEWTHIMVMVVSITITVERAFNCMKYSQRKNCSHNILWRFLHKKSYFGEKRRASGTMWALTTSSSIVPTFCNGLKERKLFLFFLTN